MLTFNQYPFRCITAAIFGILCLCALSGCTAGAGPGGIAGSISVPGVGQLIIEPPRMLQVQPVQVVPVQQVVPMPAPMPPFQPAMASQQFLTVEK